MGMGKEPSPNSHNEMKQIKETYEINKKMAYPVQMFIETPKDERHHLL